jgi:hypothetical protein
MSVEDIVNERASTEVASDVGMTIPDSLLVSEPATELVDSASTTNSTMEAGIEQVELRGDGILEKEGTIASEASAMGGGDSNVDQEAVVSSNSEESCDRKSLTVSDSLIFSDFVIMNYTQTHNDGPANRISRLNLDNLEEQKGAPLSHKSSLLVPSVAIPDQNVIDFSKTNINSINDIFSGSHNEDEVVKEGDLVSDLEAQEVVEFERFNPDHEESGFFSNIGGSLRVSTERPGKLAPRKDGRMPVGLAERKRSSSSSAGRKEAEIRKASLGNV